MNVRTRLTVWQAGILAVLLLIFGLSLYGALFYHLNAEVDDALISWTDQAAESVRGMTDPRRHVGPGRDGPALMRPNAPESFSLVLDSAGRVTLTSDFEAQNVLPGLKRFLRSVSAAEGRYTIDLGGRRYRIFIDRVTGSGNGTETIAISGRSLSHVQSTLASLGFFLGLAWLVAVVACAVISWLFVEGTLRPIKRMTRDSLMIAESGELRQRIRELGSNDEFGRLSKALNQMLASLEKSYQTQKQFLADASHELRTPLTSIMANVGYLKRARGLPESEQDAALKDIATEVNRMSKLVSQLLLLARSGVAPMTAPERVDLARIVTEVASGLHWKESGRQLSTEANGPAFMIGHSDSLRQLVVILFDNALKYSPMHGEIRVYVGCQKERAILTVVDTGPGIPPQEIDLVFGTFYRASNVRDLTAGSGLGLSIAHSIITNHGGKISLANGTPSGLSVTVSFLLAPPCGRFANEHP